ncbi:hypothetical protein M0657_011606 [Pyricularia oryzae]|nr:hypothetical protein M0657_011606 [Pyricularia oryzae]
MAPATEGSFDSGRGCPQSAELKLDHVRAVQSGSSVYMFSMISSGGHSTLTVGPFSLGLRVACSKVRQLGNPTIAMRRQYLDLGIFALLCIPFSAALPVNDDKALVRRPKFEVAAVPAREYAPPAQEYAGPPPPQVPSPPPAPDLRAAQGRSSRTQRNGRRPSVPQPQRYDNDPGYDAPRPSRRTGERIHLRPQRPADPPGAFGPGPYADPYADPYAANNAFHAPPVFYPGVPRQPPLYPPGPGPMPFAAPVNMYPPTPSRQDNTHASRPAAAKAPENIQTIRLFWKTEEDKVQQSLRPQDNIEDFPTGSLYDWVKKSARAAEIMYTKDFGTDFKLWTHVGIRMDPVDGTTVKLLKDYYVASGQKVTALPKGSTYEDWKLIIGLVQGT